MKRFLIILVILSSASFIFGQPCDIPSATNNCESAPIICDIDILDGYCTSMSSILTFNAPAPMCSNGGSPHNPLWFAFYAGCTELQLTIHLSGCDTVNGTTGVQAAIYRYGGNGLCLSSTDQPDEILDCDVVCPGDESITLNPVGLTLGHIYYFAIDGCAGSACDLTISVDTPCGEPDINTWSEPIDGPLLACKGSFLTYTIAPPMGAIEFWWYLDGVEIVAGPENFLDIQWPEAGIYELCVDASNLCLGVFENPSQTCITIEVHDVTTSEDPDSVLICENETYSYGGQNYPPGIHEVVLITPEGCDSVVTLTVNSAPVKQTELGAFYLCESDIVMVANTPISCNQQGSQEIVLSQAAYPYCDSIISFDVVCLSLDAYVFDPPILGVDGDTVELDGSNSLVDPSFYPTYFDWFKVNTTSWQWVGDSTHYLTSEAGTFCLVVTIVSPDSLAICEDTACVTVEFMSPVYTPSFFGEWIISPVPAKAYISLQCTGNDCPQNGLIECWDVLGQKQKIQQIETWVKPIQFSVSDWPSGPYWITWTGKDQRRMLIGKAMVQR